MEAAPVSGPFHLVHCSTRGFVHGLPFHVLTSCSSPRCTCMSALTKTPSASRPAGGWCLWRDVGRASSVCPRACLALFATCAGAQAHCDSDSGRSTQQQCAGTACLARTFTDRGQAAPVRRGGRTEGPGLGTVGARDGAGQAQWALGRAGDGTGNVAAAPPPAAVGERTRRAVVGQMVRPCRDCVAQGLCGDRVATRVRVQCYRCRVRCGQTCVARAPVKHHLQRSEHSLKPQTQRGAA